LFQDPSFHPLLYIFVILKYIYFYRELQFLYQSIYRHKSAPGLIVLNIKREQHMLAPPKLLSYQKQR
jgi:hypothetical protein